MFQDSVQGRVTSFARIARVGPNELIATGARAYRRPDDDSLVNRDTLGFVPVDLILLRSADDAHTWSRPETIEPPLEGAVVRDLPRGDRAARRPLALAHRHLEGLGWRRAERHEGDRAGLVRPRQVVANLSGRLGSIRPPRALLGTVHRGARPTPGCLQVAWAYDETYGA